MHFLLIFFSSSLRFILKYLCRNMGIYFSLRSLWKSYMFNCLTKEENLRCLKYLGRMVDSNLSLFLTIKLFPLSVQLIVSLFYLSCIIEALPRGFWRFCWWRSIFRSSCWASSVFKAIFGFWIVFLFLNYSPYGNKCRLFKTHKTTFIPNSYLSTPLNSLSGFPFNNEYLAISCAFYCLKSPTSGK